LHGRVISPERIRRVTRSSKIEPDAAVHHFLLRPRTVQMW
jgi:hypothetical protein